MYQLKNILVDKNIKLCQYNIRALYESERRNHPLRIFVGGFIFFKKEIDMTKYIFVTGGVVSSLGKGIVAASVGRVLKNRGLKVTLQKFDPYLNVDPGTMSPYQHGEVFVTEDGAETDLDQIGRAHV